MFRTPTLLAALALIVGCGDRDGAATSTTLGITSVTTWTPGASSSSTGPAAPDTGSGTDAAASSTTTGTSTTTGSSTSTTTDSTTSTTDPSLASTTAESTGTTAVDPIQQCLAMVDPGDECTACICTDCLALWDMCQANEGCAAIQACSQTGHCYDIHCLAPCSQIINFYGGPYGDPFEMWRPLSMCLKATCETLCPW